MQKAWKKGLLACLTLGLTVSAPLFTWAADKEIVILHTNDIHCGVNDNLGLSTVAQMKREALKNTPYVALVDAGDAVQGAPIGKMSRGEAVVKMMNATGYDFAIPGNHEFDYGMERFWQLAKKQNCGYYSANFTDLRTKKLALPPYKMLRFGDTKVALVGATTPGTLISSTPAFFQDGQGNYLYGFNEDETGQKLYKSLQKSINAARENGADYVFVVGHLGLNGSIEYWNSESVAANTRGVDAIIDGHSHERIQGKYVKNYVGQDVLIAQTGTKLKTVGELVIGTDGKITSRLLKKDIGDDAKTQKIISREIAKYEKQLQQPVGEALIQLKSNDPKNGERLVRNNECSLADFVTDAYKAVLGCDAVLVNGGSIRNEIKQGVITYNDMLEAFPFGNMCAVIEVTGQKILDALEMGASHYPKEFGGFYQVAGMEYTINASVPSTVQLDDKGNFSRVGGLYRVSDVRIGGQPLDLNKKYTVGGTTYVLKDGGDGNAMFKGCKILKDGEISDVDAIIEYLQKHLNGKIGDEYANPYGKGRITIK
ncbi:MAG: bifunctional UDP-sugar hydrolase/5'-nucleotidase [Phascolarctobacterium sp.]|nr:bifunctional UDP-sugar hydrolase/5'-nucleotidase [Phascolarctobacterium sp.]